jgi:adenylate kinase
MSRCVVLITGPPGAGKGTQSRILASRHGWHTFSIGQLLRDTADPDIKQKIDAGNLLPTEHVTRLVMEEIQRQEVSVVVDGFPRRLDQSREFNRIAPDYDINTYTVVALQVDEEESWQRVKDRGREDDERAAWEHRWDEYYQHTVPAIEHARQGGVLTEIDGHDDIETVTRALERTFHAA